MAKLFRKETLVTDESSCVCLPAPIVAFGCYLIVPLLIPVLTTYPLPLGYSGDILGGGFVLALAGFSVALAGTESGAPYAQLGSSRAVTFGALIEPTILFVVFAIALITAADLPYARRTRPLPPVARRYKQAMVRSLLWSFGTSPRTSASRR